MGQPIVDAFVKWILSTVKSISGSKKPEQKERQVAGGTITPAKKEDDMPMYTAPAPARGSGEPTPGEYAMGGVDPTEISYLKNLEKLMSGMNFSTEASKNIMQGKPAFKDGLSGQDNLNDFA